MINLFTLFRKPLSPDERFVRVEDQLVSKFSQTEKYRFDFSESQKREGKHRQEANEIQAQNPGLQIASKSAETRTAMRRLKNRKWLAVGVDALLAVSTIQMLFLILVHVDLSKGTSGSSGFAAILKPLLVGIGVAYALLKLAIDYRHDDSRKEGNVLTRFWNQYSWVLPLLFIPFVNMFLVITHPGSPYNILWIGLAVFSILLNLKAASYSQQFILMEHTNDVEKQAKPAQDGIKKEQSIQDKINSVMVDIKSEIIELATQYRRLYEGSTVKPQLALAHPYRFVLNTRIYFQDVLPVPPPQITLPGGALGEYQKFWDVTTRINVKDNIQPELDAPANITGANENPDNNSNAQQQNQDTAQNENGNGENPNTGNRNTNNNAAGDFGDALSDNEIIV